MPLLSESTFLAVLAKIYFNCLTVRLGLASKIKAMTPEAIGADADALKC